MTTIIVTPAGSTIVATGIVLPPMGMRSASIVYTIKKNSGNVVRTYNPCGWTPIAQSENHPSFGVYTKVQMAIDIPQVVLASDIPKPGDFFVGPDGNTYNVIARQSFSVFFCRVVGFDPIISYDLDTTINILPPVDSTDAYLSPLTARGNAGGNTNLHARIQFWMEEAKDFQGIQFFRPWYRIYVQNLEQNLAIGTTVTCNSGEYAGTIFRVVSNENIEQLQELECLVCTVDPSP